MGHHEASQTGLDYAEVNIPWKGLFVWMIGMFLGVCGVMALVYFLYGFPKQHPVPEIVLTRTMNQPVLQSSARKELKVFLEEQNTQLSTYGWVSRAQGTVRIPIQRAMEMVLQKGFPAREAKQP